MFPRIDRTRRALALGTAAWAAGAAASAPGGGVAILVYHRFADSVADSMTVRHATIASHLATIDAEGCAVVALQDVAAWHRDGFCAPLARRGLPHTLFIYPSAISNAAYALNWDEVRAAAKTPGCRIESHTWWHPNFERERRRLEPAEFLSFARTQLAHPREVITRESGRVPELLAWPFGLYDAQLEGLAADVGYRAAFALGNRAAVSGDDRYALPRRLMSDAITGPRLAALLRAEVAR